MWIQVRTTYGDKSFQVDGLSKLTKIEDLKLKMEQDLEVPPIRQRLFFAGKQLEDGHTLYDYSVKRNSLIQVMIRPVEAVTSENKNNKQIDVSGDKCEEKEKLTDIINQETNGLQEEKPIEKDCEATTSYRWKIGDCVDGKDLTMGAWFEALVKKIDVDENGDIRYHVIYDGYDESEIIPLSEKDVRPRARTKISYEDVESGMIVMANYNCDEKRERGFWYDVEVTRKVKKRNGKEIYGKLLLGKDNSVAEECKIIFTDEIFAIESSDAPLSESEEAPEKRKVRPDCITCRDDPNKKCKDCGCYQCGGKDDPDKQLMCDECDQPYHMRCLDPPLTSLPEEDEWYCPLCKNDGSAVIKAGEKLKESKKKSKMASANPKGNRDWGKGMACVGRTKVCTIVPPNHFGPIPGVPVGSCWKFRVQASESGVHRPHVSGMHGRDSDGAYSIVLAGGYEDDTDDGEEFTYTGSGGRDLSGNKRTAEQSFDQTLTKTNKALAKNCDCPIDTKKGGQANDWKKGKPIRVIRSFKFAKHSKYAPEEGVRYDGIYKVVKYWPEKGQSGFIVWRYRLRRDDQYPAPWTAAGKKTIRDLGLQIQYPEGYLEAQAKKEAEKLALKNEKKGKRKRKDDDDEEEQTSDGKSDSSPKKSPHKKAKTSYKIPEDSLGLIKKDVKNKKIWNEIIEVQDSHQKFLQEVEERFICICCQELVYQPVTVECGHSTCKSCLQRAFKAGVVSCPSCRFGLDKDYVMDINRNLGDALKKLFPGYDAAR